MNRAYLGTGLLTAASLALLYLNPFADSVLGPRGERLPRPSHHTGLHGLAAMRPSLNAEATRSEQASLDEMIPATLTREQLQKQSARPANRQQPPLWAQQAAAWTYFNPSFGIDETTTLQPRQTTPREEERYAAGTRASGGQKSQPHAAQGPQFLGPAPASPEAAGWRHLSSTPNHGAQPTRTPAQTPSNGSTDSTEQADAYAVSVVDVSSEVASPNTSIVMAAALPSTLASLPANLAVTDITPMTREELEQVDLSQQ